MRYAGVAVVVCALAVVSSISENLAAQEPLPPIEAVQVGPYPEKIVWPISGTATQDPGFSSTFGPRQLAVDGYRHDFNRGVDIPCDPGTPIHAVTAGEVRIAGKSDSYQLPLVQIRSYKPDSGESCDDGGCFTINYMNMAEFDVKAGDKVEAGQVIGRSGLSPRGYRLVRLELRDGGPNMRFCVHPLSILPYKDDGPPQIMIDGAAVVRDKTTIAVTATVPGDELDLLRVEVALFDGPTEVARKTYDLHEWNRAYTPAKEPTKILDQQTVNGVRAEPGQFRSGQLKYELTLVFEDFPVVKNGARAVIKAKAVDIRGNASKEAERKGVR